VDRLRRFREYINLPDVFVVLRHPSAGETSGSVIKAMGAGKPVIVSDHFAFSEFPDDCCVKIPTGEAEQDVLMERLVYYIENPEERLELGERSRRYIQTHHDIQDAARGYVEFAAELLSS
jgi:glycosyltransferase involved in cell wall biosynthesis